MIACFNTQKGKFDQKHVQIKNVPVITVEGEPVT
jgi:hypothetical protein